MGNKDEGLFKGRMDRYEESDAEPEPQVEASDTSAEPNSDGELEGMVWSSPSMDEFLSGMKQTRPKPEPPKKGRLSKKELAKYEKALDEWEWDQLISRIRSSQFPRTMRVMMMNQKGGVGKTLTTHCIAAALAFARADGSVAAYDASEVKGTLLSRVENRPKRGLVELEKNAGKIDSLPTLISYGTRQTSGAVIFGRLKQDDVFSHTDISVVDSELSRFFSVLIADSANNPFASVFTEVLETTDAVVIPTIVGIESAIAMIQALDQYLKPNPKRDYPYRPDLMSRTVIVLTHDREPADEPKTWYESIKATIEGLKLKWVEVPYDDHLRTSATFTWDRLSRESKKAWLKVAATVTEVLEKAPEETRKSRSNGNGDEDTD